MSTTRTVSSARALRKALSQFSKTSPSLSPSPSSPLRFNTINLTPISSIPTQISCAVVPDATSLVRVTAEDLFTRYLSHIRQLSHRASLTAVGDSLLFFRSDLRHAYAARVIRMLRRSRKNSSAPRVVSRFASPVSVCNAAAGMGLAAIVAQEQRDSSGPVSLLRLLSSTEGPHRIGIGLIPGSLRTLLGWLLGCFMMGAMFYCAVLFPQAVPWGVLGAVVCFAARPDLESFSNWAKRCAPDVAKRKTMLLDKVRAQLAPYVMMRLRKPVLDDYGLFSVVTVQDHADYVYVYAGALSRWCLLGWYNVADDYDFDRILGMR